MCVFEDGLRDIHQGDVCSAEQLLIEKTQAQAWKRWWWWWGVGGGLIVWLSESNGRWFTEGHMIEWKIKNKALLFPPSCLSFIGPYWEERSVTAFMLSRLIQTLTQACFLSLSYKHPHRIAPLRFHQTVVDSEWHPPFQLLPLFCASSYISGCLSHTNHPRKHRIEDCVRTHHSVGSVFQLEHQRKWWRVSCSHLSYVSQGY